MGPFVAAGSIKAGGISAVSCGSSTLTVDKVLNAGPPSDLPTEVGGSGGLAPPEEARICISVENHGADTLRIDRSYLMLKCPHEKQPWVPDRDPEEVILHAGEKKELEVSFHYSPLPSGEDVAVLFDGAATVGKRPFKLPPLPLRKK